MMTWLLERLRCPDCHAPGLQETGAALVCPRCKTVFPLSQGRPVLIRTDNDLFPRSSYLALAPQSTTPSRSLAARLGPSGSVNLSYDRNLRALAATLGREGGTSVLVIGAGSQKQGLDAIFAAFPTIRLVYSDIDVRGDLDLFCDAHDLPFLDETFDGVVASAVLEHVVYPERVASEIHRVLTARGLVYSEIPFLQQVHEGAYDFTRYTLSGHRRLFNNFDELSSGVSAGPGTTLLWAIEHFAQCCAPRIIRRPARLAARTGFFWLKYFDRWFGDAPAAVDGASCTYFLGRKRATPIPARDIIERYHGISRVQHT